jgi:hypothetical protein
MIRDMTGRTLRYSVGNENNPADPWGRSELVLQADAWITSPTSAVLASNSSRTST